LLAIKIAYTHICVSVGLLYCRYC